MCGIGGIFRFDGRRVDPEALAAMSAQLKHRGPDEGDVLHVPGGALVHRRLSIIDLAGSHQPMASAHGGLTLTFNGEVLNYSALRDAIAYPYATQGDTETILATHLAHGLDAPAMFAGQFAYALHDAGARTISLVRDRLGILPLFYYADERVLVFASEIPALIAGLGRVPELDADALPEYLFKRYVTAPRTLLRGVHKVRPGTVLTFGGDGTRAETGYWTTTTTTREGLTDDQVLDELDHALGRAIDRSMVADVPIGAYLSGGVDSSLVVAKARAAGVDRLHTYCADFGDPRFDETTYADEVARSLGTLHQTVGVTAEDFSQSWELLSYRRGAPLAEPADIALFKLALAAREDVKVVLSGEGSDELFGGYPKHRFARATAAAGMVPHRLRGPALGAAARHLPPRARRLGIALRSLSEKSYEDRVATWFAAFSNPELADLVGATAVFEPGRDRRTPLRRMLEHDLHRWLADNLLERADRMSMAASLELRPPFLDNDLVDFSLRLPDRFLVRRGTTKWAVKEVARRYVPARVIDRPKIGFRVPLDAWFRGELGEFARETITASDSVSSTYLSRSGVDAVLDGHASGEQDNSVKMWTLVSLDVWHRQLGRALTGGVTTG